MVRHRIFFVVIGLLLVTTIGIFFISLYFDPIVQYYGVRMRESQFNSFMLNHRPNDPEYALYCYAQPLTNLSEQSICFDSETELDSFVQRKFEIEQQLRG